MGYVYTPSSITEKEKMNTSTWCLQITHFMEKILSLFATTFLVSYIVHLNGNAPLKEAIFPIALFYIFQYFFQTLAFFFFSYIVEKTNRVWIYRVGISFKCTFIILIVFFGSKIANYTMLAGALYGVAEACFYSSYNVMKIELVPKNHASKYATVNTILEKIVNVIFPVLLGYLIDVSTYAEVAIYVFVLAIIELTISFFIKSFRPDGAEFAFNNYVKRLKLNDQDAKRVQRIYPLCLSYGLTSINNTLMTILAIYTFKTNVNLGLFTSLFAALTIISILLFNKFSKSGKRTVLYFILALFPIFAGITTGIVITKATYIIYTGVTTVFYVCFANSLEVQRAQIIKKVGMYSEITEHQMVCEICFNTTRLLSYFLMIILVLLFDVLGLRILIMVLAVAFPLMAFWLSKIEKEELKIEQNNIQNQQSNIKN